MFRMISFLTLLGVIFFLVLPEKVQAQPSHSFEKILNLALQSHPLILEKKADQSTARAEKDASEYARFPTPTFERFSSSSLGARTGVFRVDQPLWTGGKITAGIELSSARYDAASASVSESKLELTLKIISSYAEALRQRHRLSSSQSNVDEHEKLLNMIRRRVNQEISPISDQRLAESRLLQARSELVIINLSFRNSLNQLSQLCGESVGDVSWVGFEEKEVQLQLNQLIDEVIKKSPTIQRLSFNEQAASADIELKRANYFPQLSLRYENLSGGTLPSDSRALIVFSAQPGAGLSAISGVEAAISRRNSVREALSAAKRNLSERVTTSWNDWQSANALLSSASRANEISREVFDSYTRQYVIGKKSWIDVLNSVRELTQASYTLGDASAQVRSANHRLRADLGQINVY